MIETPKDFLKKFFDAKPSIRGSNNLHVYKLDNIVLYVYNDNFSFYKNYYKGISKSLKNSYINRIARAIENVIGNHGIHFDTLKNLYRTDIDVWMQSLNPTCVIDLSIELEGKANMMLRKTPHGKEEIFFMFAGDDHTCSIDNPNIFYQILAGKAEVGIQTIATQSEDEAIDIAQNLLNKDFDIDRTTAISLILSREEHQFIESTIIFFKRK